VQLPPLELDDELLEDDELEELLLDELDDELLELDELLLEELELEDELLELDELLLEELDDELELDELPSQAPCDVHSSPEPAGPLLVAGSLPCVHQFAR
jgi:hypothetical protein